MQFGRFPRKTILAATLLLAFSAANASLLEQTGTPTAPPVEMKTYGVDVATRVGLKAVIPSGWQLFVHRSVELPESLSWKVDESWVSVLNNFAKTNDIAVLVDWDKKTVHFRTTALALDEQEKRQMIAQAAATPLPSFKADEAAKSSASAAPKAPGASAAAEVKPIPPHADVAVASVEKAGATTSVTLAVGTADPVVPAVSGVASSAPAKAEPAAVATGASMFDRVLDAASKPTGAPVVTVAKTMPSAEVASVPSATAPATAPAPAMGSAMASAMAPAAAVVAAPAQPVAPAAASIQATPAASQAASAYVEQPLAGRTVGEAFNRKTVDAVVAAAAEKHGYAVSWEAADVQFPGPVTILGADMGEDMRLVLRALGGRRSPVSIDLYRGSSVVRVRNASGTAEVMVREEPFSGAIREKSVPSFTVKVAAETAQAPSAVIAPASALQQPMAPPPASVAVMAAATPVEPIAASAAPRVIVAEPKRMDTAVDTIKKLAPAVEPKVVQPAPIAVAEADVPAPAAKAVVPMLTTLRVERGESLRSAIEAVLESGWTLKWDVNGDMEANTSLEVTGESLAAVLNKVLPRLALSADIYKPSKLIVVRPADAALDK